MRGVIMLSLLLLTSCGVFRDISQSLRDARQEREAAGEQYDVVSDVLDRAHDVLDKAGSVNDQARRAADKDGDGKITGDEWSVYALMLGLLAKQQLDRRKDKKESAESVDDLHARIDHEREKRKAVESAAGKPAA